MAHRCSVPPCSLAVPGFEERAVSYVRRALWLARHVMVVVVLSVLAGPIAASAQPAAAPAPEGRGEIDRPRNEFTAVRQQDGARMNGLRGPLAAARGAPA